MNQYPTWLDLLTLWMQTHYNDKICVVFSANTGHHILMKHIPDFKSVLAPIIGADYAILICDDNASANKICNSVAEDDGYVMVWENGVVVHENT